MSATAVIPAKAESSAGGLKPLASDSRFAGATKKAPPGAPSASPARWPLLRPASPAKTQPSDDLRRPLFGARGTLCAPADLRPKISASCRAARPAPSSPSATPPPASPGRPAGRPPGDPAQHQWRRPFVHAFQQVLHVRLAGKRAPDVRHRPRPDPPAPGSRSATAAAAGSPPPARSSCRTNAVNRLSRLSKTKSLATNRRLII